MGTAQPGAVEELELEDDLEGASGAEGQDDTPEMEPEDEDAPISVEDQARAMGWHPLSEYRGDPRRWKPAAQFIADGERETPILRDQLRRTTEKLARMAPQIAEISTLKTTIGELKQALTDSLTLARKADERGYQRAVKELRDQRREAVAAGDTETFERLDEQIGAMEAERASVSPPATPPAAPSPPAAPVAPTPDPAITAFRQANPWFDTDPEMNRCMIAAHQIVMGKHPTLSLARQLEEAVKRVMVEYPERFEEDDEMPPAPISTPPRRPAAAAVARPSPPQPRNRHTSGWDTIPEAERADAKAAFNNMRRHQPDMTEDEYIALYQDPHADILSLRQARKAR